MYICVVRVGGRKKETAQLGELSQRVTSVAFDVERDVSLMSVDD